MYRVILHTSSYTAEDKRIRLGGANTEADAHEAAKKYAAARWGKSWARWEGELISARYIGRNPKTGRVDACWLTVEFIN